MLKGDARRGTCRHLAIRPPHMAHPNTRTSDVDTAALMILMLLPTRGKTGLERATRRPVICGLQSEPFNSNDPISCPSFGKALQSECEASPRARVFLVVPGLPVDHDGVAGGTRVSRVSAVSADTLTLLPATRKQFQRILSGLPHFGYGRGKKDTRTGAAQASRADSGGAQSSGKSARRRVTS